MTIATIATIAALAVGQTAATCSASESAREIAILSDAYRIGIMTPCCHKVALGGLSRRQGFYRAVRDTTPEVLCLDAGDWSPRPDDATVPRAETTRFLAACMKTMHYDAWTPGESELNLGLHELTRLAARTGAPIISANLCDRRGRPLFPAHVIFERGGIRIGVTGVTDSLCVYDCPTPEVSYHNLEAALRAVVAALRPQVDCVVVLLHAGPGAARRVAETIPGIDVLITGHNPGYLAREDSIGAVRVIRGGNRGMYAARTSLTLDAARHLVDVRSWSVPLDATVPSDSALAARVDAFVAHHHIDTNF